MTVELPELVKPAPHGKRLTAFFIDVAVIATLLKLIYSVAGNLGVTNLYGLPLYFPTLYYILLTGTIGWTPGKKILGLEVVHVDTKGSVSIMQMIGRETIGRALSTIFLGIGYLLILMNRDRQALYDQMFKTQVVSYTMEEKSSGFAYTMASLAFVFVFGTGFFAYKVYWTPYLLKVYAKVLSKNGLTIDDIRGSIKSGFVVGKIAFTNEKIDFEAKDFGVDYKNFFEVFSGKEARVQGLSVDKVTINFKDQVTLEGLFDNKPPTAKGATPSRADIATSNTVLPPGVGETVKQAPTNQIENFRVGRIDIGPIEVKLKGKPYLNIESIQSVEVTLSRDRNIFRQFYAKAKDSYISVKELVLSRDVSDFKELQALVKKEVIPTVLAGDVDVVGSFLYSSQQKTFDGKLSAFRSAVTYEGKDSVLTANITNFNPKWYFQNMPPISEVNFTAVHDLKNKSKSFGKGSYKVVSRIFNLVGMRTPEEFFPAEYAEGANKVFASFLHFATKKDGEPPVVVNLNADTPSDLPTILSTLYFQKKPVELSQTELQTIEENKKYFNLFVPGQTPRGPASAATNATPVNPATPSPSVAH